MKNLLFFLFLLTSLNGISQDKSIKVEPMNWWVGMKNPNLQLVIQGDQIKTAQVKSPKAGLSIIQVHQADSPNYLFVDVRIEKSAKVGIYPIQLFQHGKLIASISYALQAREPGSSSRESYSAKDVIYLITPDRFANGDPSNDVHPSMMEKEINRSNIYSRHGGDIQGIIDRLDYLKKMGYTAIWNMPLLENDQKVQSYHGYSITNHYQIDPRFGSNEKFKELCEEAKKRGIKVISDIVLNHIGSGHHWMKDLPFKNWINHGTQFVSTNHRRESQQDPHSSKADLKSQVDGWFVPSMPDLNQNNPFLAKYIIQNTIWWIEYAGLGGLRIDTYPYSEKKFSNAWTMAVAQEYPNMNMVGEEWSLNPIIPSYWQKGKINPDGYRSGLPSLMDFPLQNAIQEALNEPESWNQGLMKIYSVISSDIVYADPYNLVIFLDNHDMSRFYTQVKEDNDLFKMGLSLICTLRGIPQIYYGTELNFANPKSNEHGEIRKDFLGGWPGDAQDAVSGKQLKAQEKNTQEYLAKLLNWRKGNEAVTQGKMMHFAPKNGIYTYFRYTEKSKVMVIVNKNAHESLIDPTWYREILPAQAKLKDVMSGQISNLGNSIKVAPKSALIVEVL
ncbi:glycoside hydrolase family 13 protein [Aquirufa rosea]|nr:alpha-amylase family glycosyl hydrolase [Aquirufa rosea]